MTRFPAASSRLPAVCAFALVVTLAGCDFIDEGDRFASKVADFAMKFSRSPESTAVFDYIPKHGADQQVKVEIGKIYWCPHPPCYHNGAANFTVERGRSGTGYRIAAAASVPGYLEIQKPSGPVHVHMRKMNGIVEIVGLD